MSLYACIVCILTISLQSILSIQSHCSCFGTAHDDGWALNNLLSVECGDNGQLVRRSMAMAPQPVAVDGFVSGLDRDASNGANE